MDLEIPRFTPSIFDIFATPAYAQGSFSPENNAAAQASSNAATLATMDGYAANFDLIHNLQIGSSFATTQLTAAVKTLAAQMRFSWKIGKDSPGGLAK